MKKSETQPAPLDACPECTAKLGSHRECVELYYELSIYTLDHPDKELFLHQYVADAYAAQHASRNTKPITTAFALIGLYLSVEKKFTGKQVQKAHTYLAAYKRPWPVFSMPGTRASLSVSDVLAAKGGPDRDKAISAWAKSVWSSWKNEHERVAGLVKQYGPGF